MTLRISSTLLERLIAEAQASSDEICGLLFGTMEEIQHTLPCSNVAPHPETGFELDPAELIAAHKAERAGGPKIIGCYHSHPTGTASPSPRDAAAAAEDGSIWLILAGTAASAWRSGETGEHEGRFAPVALIAG